MKEKVLDRRAVKLSRKGNWFFVDGKYNRVSTEEFESVSSFSDDATAIVTSTKGEAYFINLNIAPISEKRYVLAFNFKNGIGIVYNQNKHYESCGSYVRLNNEGKETELFPGRYFSSIEMFNDKGLAYVCENGKYFTINTKGERVITPEEAEFKRIVEKEENEYYNRSYTKPPEERPMLKLLKAAIISSWIILILSSLI